MSQAEKAAHIGKYDGYMADLGFDPKSNIPCHKTNGWQLFQLVHLKAFIKWARRSKYISMLFKYHAVRRCSAHAQRIYGI
jgi:hypothetical protein